MTVGDEGRAANDRLECARALLGDLRVDGLLVSDPVGVRHLSGFRGEDAMLVVGREVALICTDSRFWAQVRREVPDFTLEETDDLLPEAVAAAGRVLGEKAALAFQGGHLTYAEHRQLRRIHGGGLRDMGARLERLRVVKDAAEAAAVRRACDCVDEALRRVAAQGLVGRREDEVAWQMIAEMHALGAEGASFPPIVGSGPNGALAHAIPGERVIGQRELVVIDTGAVIDGYCSDITRTFATGELEGELRHIYDVTFEAQAAGLAAVKPGARARDVDAAARDVIAAAGYGEHFGHGLGHGVGMLIHEGPRLSRRSRDVLVPGMVVTVEPGIYLEDLGGVRIEDTVLVTEAGGEALTRFPKELTVVS